MEARNDVGACLIVGLSEIADQDPAEPSTIDPEVAEQQRRLGEEQQAQQAADRAVAQASTNLALAVDTLRFAADDASAAAAVLDDSLKSIEQALDEQQELFDELIRMIEAGSTGEFWVDDVTFKSRRRVVCPGRRRIRSR